MTTPRRQPPSFALAFALGALTLSPFASPSPAAAQETALTELRAAARAGARDYDAQLALGRALLQAGRFREAAGVLRRASRLRRADPAAAYEPVRVAFAQRNYRLARSQCNALSRAHPDHPIGHVCMARAFLAWNRSARAFEELEAALAQAPNDYEALLALGDAHRLRAAVDESEAAYRRAISADGTRAAPHLGLGQLYAQALRRDDALRALRRAHELDGDDPDVDFELGRLLTGAEAVSHLRDAVANRPGFALAQGALGDALMASGEHEPAAAAYRAAIASDSHLASARAGLGRALAAAGQNEEAERVLRAAIEEVPNDADSAIALGDVLAATNRVEAAYEQYRHAADLDPRNPGSLNRAARLALQQERPVLAVGFLQRVLGTHANNAEALALMGDVMRARRRPAQAREFYQRALGGAEGTIDRARVQRALAELPQ